MLRNQQGKKTEPLELFSVRLRAAISRCGMTLQDVAKACDVAVSTVGAWTQAKNWPQVEVQPRLARCLNSTIAFLIHGLTEEQEPGRQKTANLETEHAGSTEGEKKSQIIRRPLSPFAKLRDDASNKDRMELAAEFAAVKEPTREQCLAYLAAYIVAAAEKPGGLGHVWWELNRTFPLELPEKITDPK